ncbi:uncharacterized protein NMK_2447 [Novimethylophilus kurashikiensis]|uniref:Uncharacterized protein n=1 Tax=Novimethylophilus kurashikiensis TaxID=1825523 RepID=A0A2R5F9F6_9PROT|nr:hypothetical protein [Novimethylophilus kurashikiensis]GBG14846.1 uncharacterized protein NMK_2447 [Novimethylophilus kurashikiensis]
MKKTAWSPVSRPPKLSIDEGWRRVSSEVQGYFKDGRQRVVYLARTEGGDQVWYTADSEGWDVSDTILYWKPLDAGPHAAQPAKKHLKVLPLEYWMANEDALESTLDYDGYRETEPRIKRPGIYSDGKNCWFETKDGRAFVYGQDKFDLKLSVFNAERLSRRQAEALAGIAAAGLATPQQKELLRQYLFLIELQDTGRRARLYLMERKKAPKHAYFLVYGLETGSPHLVRVPAIQVKTFESVRANSVTHEMRKLRGQGSWAKGLSIEYIQGQEGGEDDEVALIDSAYAGAPVCADFTLWDVASDWSVSVFRERIQPATGASK